MRKELRHEQDGSITRIARITGGIYLLYFIAGMPLILRGSLIVRTDAAATAAKIAASETLYRATIVTDLVSYCLYLGLAYLFYLLLRNVSRPWALMGTLFTVAGCIVLIMATAALTAPLALLTGNEFTEIATPERQELALLALKVYTQAFIIGLLLFGVQWLIMGPLFALSGFVPRPIGYLLTLGGVAWVSFAVASLIAPPIGMAMQPVVLAIGSLAEISLALWLLLRGARSRTAGTAAAEVTRD
ncbi:MAG TPA: DUF4386 domain-containing protein [Sphingomicrobium sp.]|nr:DUF4386 domain-containing protein [Sphingomicrobium sp.]